MFARIGALFTRHPVLWLFVITFAVAAFVNPIKIGTFLFGVSKLAAFAWLGNWIDRRFFSGEQPEDYEEGLAKGTAWKRKGMIISAAIVAGALV